MQIDFGRSAIRWAVSKRLQPRFKNFALVLLLFILIVLSIDITFGKNLILVFDSSRAGSLQVFFPSDSHPVFTETRSVRTNYSQGARQKLEIRAPFHMASPLRIDPMEHSGQISLESMQVKSFLFESRLNPLEVQKRIVGSQDLIQHIISTAVDAPQLLIRADGVDPIVLISLAGMNASPSPIGLLLVTVFAIIMGAYLFNFSFIGLLSRSAGVVVLPVIISGLIVMTFYPGYMTYDSFHALRSARNGVTESAWPPIVSYVWRIVELIIPHPSGMFFAQVFILLFSTSIVAYLFSKRLGAFTFFSLIVLSVPVMIGTLSSIWKDVLMAAFILSGFAMALAICRFRNRLLIYLSFCLSWILLLFATSSRHNAILATLPIFFYLSSQLTIALNISRPKIASFLLFLFLASSTMAIKIGMDRYALPNLAPISGSNTLVRIVRKMDIAGASICSGDNMIKNVSPSVSLDDIKKSYDPRHSNLSIGMLDSMPMNAVVDELWIETFKKHPFCFFRNKLDLAKYLLGLNHGEQFLVFSPQVDANEYGYTLPENDIRSFYEKYIISSSRLFMLRPWFLWLVFVVSLVFYFIARRSMPLGYIALSGSGALYALGLFLLGNAADARLLFYTNYIFCLIAVLMAFEICSKSNSLSQAHRLGPGLEK